ncbi:HU family DNA-binding protein [Mesomycoplasma lagogenitalium]|uniref:HU family DNA-binding protein n=1 Tax=Mesomycoplasma lagogenitalium TaxID=171286 RepID=UPI003A7F2805
MIEDFLLEIVEKIKKGEDVKLKHLGTFKIKNLEKYKFYNFTTSTFDEYENYKKLKFSVNKKLKNKLIQKFLKVKYEWAINTNINSYCNFCDYRFTYCNYYY